MTGEAPQACCIYQRISASGPDLSPSKTTRYRCRVAGIYVGSIYSEKLSGSVASRPELNRLMNDLKRAHLGAERSTASSVFQWPKRGSDCPNKRIGGNDRCTRSDCRRHKCLNRLERFSGIYYLASARLAAWRYAALGTLQRQSLSQVD